MANAVEVVIPQELIPQKNLNINTRKIVYKYKINVTRVVDGDTVDADIDLGFGMTYKKQRIRLMGIDTPESRTRNLTENFMVKHQKLI